MATLPADVILLICEELGNQHAFGTLFNVAVSSKYFAGPALLWLYSERRQGPTGGSDINEDQLTTGNQLVITSQWASQWRSIMLSTLGKTAYPYCLYIRSLDLTSLVELLIDNKFRKHLTRKFFAGDMVPFLKIYQRRALGIAVASQAVANMVGEHVSRFAGDTAARHGGTAALDELRGDLQEKSLSDWIKRIPRIKSLRLWQGAILTENLADLIKSHCLNFDALTVYECRGDGFDIDGQLASFFGQLRMNTLRHLQVISINDLGPQTFISLNNHYLSLKYLSLRSLLPSAIMSLPLLKGCTAIEELDLEESAGIVDLAETDRGVLLEIVSWLQSCKQLRSIKMEHFINGPFIMASVCVDETIRLDSLQLKKYTLTGNQLFHKGLKLQESLLSVHLRADTENSDENDVRILLAALGGLKKLKYLNILEISDNFSNFDIQSLVLSLPQLEDLSVGGQDVDDDIWDAILTLSNLRSMSFHAVTYFTSDGILRYIDGLLPTNVGLHLSVMCADVSSELSWPQIHAIRSAIARKVNGKFDIELHREGSDGSYTSDID